MNTVIIPYQAVPSTRQVLNQSEQFLDQVNTIATWLGYDDGSNK